MPQSLSQVWLHLVFSTKNRDPTLVSPPFREQMFKMLAHELGGIGCFPRLAGGWIDHAHLVFGMSRTASIAEVVEHVKTETSRWAKKIDGGTNDFTWQSGYAVFSVSQSQLETVMEYVRNQEQHHAKRSFQDELRELCRRHGVEIDERYVWD